MSKEMGFEQVWQQLLEVAEMKKSPGICTLGRGINSRGVHNQIVSISERHITVMSEKPYKSLNPNRRELKERSFQKVWKEVLVYCDGGLFLDHVSI